MARIFAEIKFNTDELLKEAQEIQEMAEELGRKVYRFRIKAEAVENSSSESEEEQRN